MKKLLLLSVGIIFTIAAQSQSMVNDAIALADTSLSSTAGSRVKLNASQPKVKNILYKYIRIKGGSQDVNLQDTFSDNPFFAVSGSGQEPVLRQLTGAFNNLTAGLGGLNVTSIADALAIVVVNRLKTELDEQFFENFKKALNENDELKALFPNTWAVLNTINTDIYDYKAYIAALREAFNSDLKNIYPNLGNFFKSPQVQKALDKYPRAKEILGAAMLTSELVSADKSPADLISEIAKSGVFSDTLKDVFQTIDLISKSLLDTAKKEIWVDVEQVREMLNTPNALQIYVGLLYHKADGITVNGKNLRNILEGHKENIQKIGEMLIAVSTEINEVEDLINQYKTDTARKSFMKYYDYYGNFTASLKAFALNVDTILHLNIEGRINQYYMVSQNLGTIYLNANEGNYTGAVTTLVSTVYIVACNNPATCANTRLDSTLQRILKYGTFMATVVQAKSSEELTGALNSFILPSGSSSMKQKTAVLVTLNSYIGGFYSWKTDRSDTVRESAGLSLPVGPNISFGLKKNKLLGAISVFMPIVDIGAFGAYRLTDSSSAALPEIKLANIFSPGFMVGLGRVGNTPLTIMGGIQKSPPLQKINSTGATFTEASWRWQVSLTWDIPLFNLYYKSKK